MSKRQIYLKINANCGNQFFQYAFARMLQEHYGGELTIDYSYVIRGYHKDNNGLWPGSDNLLKDFNVAPYKYVRKTSNPKFLIIQALKLFRIIFGYTGFNAKTYRFYLWSARVLEQFGIYYFEAPYYPFKLNAKSRNIIVQGYFESAEYFKSIDEQIKKELTSKHQLLEQNQKLYDVIVNKESVCITIKRMDVENEEIADVYAYDIEYFYNAVEYIEEKVSNPVWIVFSDDIDWCKKNFILDGEIYYEPSGNPIWDKIKIMSACKHFIIHNSTFSWWAQHLSTNNNKIVIAPTKWVERNDEPIDIYENDWIFMRNDGTIQDGHD